jgi:hypothetical protein
LGGVFAKKEPYIMVSAVESMAANTSWSALGKATDLRNRILFTLGLLIVYRLGTFIPVPGIDGTALRQFMVHRRRTWPYGDLCLGYHALHLCIDHRSADDLDGARA